MKKVTIYQRVLPHYRLPFFRKLNELLAENGYVLKVVAGYEDKGTVPKTVVVNEDWVEYRKNIYVRIFGRELVFQKAQCKDLSSDSIIVEQSNRLILNYILIALKPYCSYKLGLWGHGRNFQSKTPSGLLEKFKKIVSRKYDWWFCYTDRGRELMAETGVPFNHITVVKNSIELDDFNGIDELSPKSLCVDSVEFSKGQPIGVYCGGMYSEKRIDFLLRSICRVKEEIPDFKMIFIGDGPESYKVKKFVGENFSWCVYLGAVSGKDRAVYFAVSKVFLMPGLVGLAVLDSFAAGVPMITTEYQYHSPEIDYMLSGKNGLISKNDEESYSRSVVQVLSDDVLYRELLKGCLDAKEEFSISTMAANYFSGVIALMENQ